MDKETYKSLVEKFGKEIADKMKAKTDFKILVRK